MIAAPAGTTAPTAPGRLGQALATTDAVRYLEALGTWRDTRKRELDLLDEAALGAPNEADFTNDMLLSMALWKAVSDRYDLLVATWDSGRVGSTELERRLSVFAAHTNGSSASAMPAAGRCGACGDPRGPGACSMN